MDPRLWRRLRSKQGLRWVTGEDGFRRPTLVIIFRGWERFFEGLTIIASLVGIGRN